MVRRFSIFLQWQQAHEIHRFIQVGKNGQYTVEVYKIGDIFFYVSEHPQCKNESTHIAALIEAISKNS